MIKQKEINLYISKLRTLFENISEPGGGIGFRFWHGLRVMTYVKNFLNKYPDYFKKYKIDRDVAIIAALFHDVGKIKATNVNKVIDYGSRGNLNHPKIGSEIIKKILGHKNLSNKKINKIAQVIAKHDTPEKHLPESLLISDCDTLDNCGLLKLWRTITYADYQKRNVDRVWEYWEKENGFKKIEDEIQKISFSPIKKVAIKRLKKLNKVIKDMKQEDEGKDFSLSGV